MHHGGCVNGMSLAITSSDEQDTETDFMTYATSISLQYDQGLYYLLIEC